MIFPNLRYRNAYLLIASCSTGTARINPPTFTSEVISVAIKIKSCSIVYLGNVGWNNGLVLKPAILDKWLETSKVNLIIESSKIKSVTIRSKGNCRKNLICRKSLNSTVNKVKNKRVLKVWTSKLI